MSEEPEAPEGLAVGLCVGCRHVRMLETKIGATIYLCQMSAKNPRFPRFPALPVLACEGFQKRDDNAPDH